jgi:hypothetical protein
MYQRTSTREASFTFANSVISVKMREIRTIVIISEDPHLNDVQVRPIYVTLQRTESLKAMLTSVFATFSTHLWIIMLSITLTQVDRSGESP